jgi:hypothetical protein
MSTGIAKMKTAANRAKGLRFEANSLVVAFRDGRELHVPLTLYPTLLRATPAQRQAWEMIGQGKGFHWPKLDLDLSADGLIQGLREAIPSPPKLSTRRLAFRP